MVRTLLQSMTLLLPLLLEGAHSAPVHDGQRGVILEETEQPVQEGGQGDCAGESREVISRHLFYRGSIRD